VGTDGIYNMQIKCITRQSLVASFRMHGTLPPCPLIFFLARLTVLVPTKDLPAICVLKTLACLYLISYLFSKLLTVVYSVQLLHWSARPARS